MVPAAARAAPAGSAYAGVVPPARDELAGQPARGAVRRGRGRSAATAVAEGAGLPRSRVRAGPCRLPAGGARARRDGRDEGEERPGTVPRVDVAAVARPVAAGRQAPGGPAEPRRPDPGPGTARRQARRQSPHRGLVRPGPGRRFARRGRGTDRPGVAPPAVTGTAASSGSARARTTH